MERKLTYTTWDEECVNKNLESIKDTMDVIRWTYREYGDKVVYACSFGIEGIVLIDLINKINKKARIIFLDTGLHFKETYELINKVKERYPELTIKLIKPSLSLEEQKNEYGDKLWERDPNLCCHLRKIIPLTKELEGNLAWISGLRHEQSPTRKHLKFINKDDKFKLIKVCPLIYWTWEDIWSYVGLNNLDYNKLHDENYPSIGCEKCTVPVENNRDFRGGRWSTSKKTECGLHG
ncbi:phosphoadenosine phosphosulfate reductase [Evansella vedderi]|uniref:Adenosine 5'-phosphosulfate reductase n=1 Tax=Evansella vedderi TaxID=38282 RepID=A0ABU0A3I0_9BACI|nr:phosphoadenylyl-sulfate reductase [Evansella vedderi]MDQ0258051.1 phosphoadenosine phosphosulfate reductase [Evansella vedderi]